MASIKCVVIGDGTVGKTCMLMSYSKNEFPNDYVPTVFDSYEVTIMVAGQQYSIKLFDTAGQEEFDRVRVLTYPETDVFLICYSVVSNASFKNVEVKWHTEIKQQKVKCPFLLVGTKTDLRNDRHSLTPISADEGRRKAKRIGATKYVECSALTKEGLKDVFDEAILAALSSPKSSGKKKIKSKCVVL